jgi:hypothetical protein
LQHFISYFVVLDRVFNRFQLCWVRQIQVELSMFVNLDVVSKPSLTWPHKERDMRDRAGNPVFREKIVALEVFDARPVVVVTE